jgi:hypothetical protein
VIAPVLAVEGVNPDNDVWNDVTPVFVRVMDPVLLATLIPVPAVRVASVNPVPFPMRSSPFAGVEVIPVPPLETFKLPLNTTAPVDALVGLKPVVPALNDVTPVFVSVMVPPNDTKPPPLRPVPAVTVKLEFASIALVIAPLGIDTMD